MARLKEREQLINHLLHWLPEVASLNLRTVELHAGIFYPEASEFWYQNRSETDYLDTVAANNLDMSETDNAVTFIQANFPNLKNIHVILEQQREPSHWLNDLFSVTFRRLLDLTYVSTRLSRMRIYITGAFFPSDWTMSGFQVLLDDLSKLPRLQEVEIFFQTRMDDFIDYSGTTNTPVPSTDMIAYLISEQAILGPYLSGLAAALPRVKNFEIWRYRVSGYDMRVGTQPIMERELLDLLGGRARNIDLRLVISLWRGFLSSKS